MLSQRLSRVNKMARECELVASPHVERELCCANGNIKSNEGFYLTSVFIVSVGDPNSSESRFVLCWKSMDLRNPPRSMDRMNKMEVHLAALIN
jgi:hypothetical protein